MPKTRTALGPLSRFRDRELSSVVVDDMELAVVRWSERVFVMRNRCPHQLGPVCEGIVVSWLGSRGGSEIVVDDNHPVVVCPWHRWEFDLPSGAALRDPKVRLRQFPAWVVEDQVFADLTGRPPTEPEQ